MAIINITCPKCNGFQWSEANFDNNTFLCSGCGEQINDEDLIFDIGLIQLTEETE